ncbi:TrmH family RNA methyltransferase [Cytobacillus purgationiresistens]|uniref:TrmH family RNA methyltransferase n=1 Tax=Cytobacillus purgationiresistens TaxID=863449 RepID=A0ABU0AGA6_9BACI|nr:RNA methyltransferase [Cytobacillus purgationiresistens]MDQ0270060.1 TrmH family RNA methyltransferase [Cytobacillus purgationiresistens]
MKHIHSAKNPQVKQWKKLSNKKERDLTGSFLIEGFHLVEEALRENRIEEIIISETKDIPPSWDYGETSVTIVTDEVISQLTETEAPQGIIAVCNQLEAAVVTAEKKKYLLIDAVQDPGNLGTMIRTADAAGVDAIIVGTGSVDIYNSKVLRSAQGSHFHLPIIRGDLKEWIGRLKEADVPVYGTSLDRAQAFTAYKPSEAFALMMGNEGNGVSKDLLAMTTANLYIPLYGKSESLNVGIAAGILLYYLRK